MVTFPNPPGGREKRAEERTKGKAGEGWDGVGGGLPTHRTARMQTTLTPQSGRFWPLYGQPHLTAGGPRREEFKWLARDHPAREWGRRLHSGLLTPSPVLFQGNTQDLGSGALGGSVTRWLRGPGQAAHPTLPLPSSCKMRRRRATARPASLPAARWEPCRAGRKTRPTHYISQVGPAKIHTRSSTCHVAP